MIPAIRIRIRVWYETNRSQLLHSPRQPNGEPPCKISAHLFLTIPGSSLISGSGDSGSYSGWITDRSQLLHCPRKPNDEPPCKVSGLLVVTIPRSPLITGSCDLGLYSGQRRTLFYIWNILQICWSIKEFRNYGTVVWNFLHFWEKIDFLGWQKGINKIFKSIFEIYVKSWPRIRW